MHPPRSPSNSLACHSPPLIIQPREVLCGNSGILDVAVVGAGWAGLGVSYALQQLGLDHVVLERAAIGETWRRQRWDLFHMNTPNLYTVLPGDRYEGPDPEGAT